MYGSGNLADFLSARVAFTFPLEGDCFLVSNKLTSDKGGILPWHNKKIHWILL
jgi:hypothetical protein